MMINNVNINIVSLIISYVLIGEADFKLYQSHSSHNTTSLCVLCAQIQTYTQILVSPSDSIKNTMQMLYKHVKDTALVPTRPLWDYQRSNKKSYC